MTTANTGPRPRVGLPAPAPPGRPAWFQELAAFQQPSTPRAVWQVCTSLPPFGLLWWLAYRALEVAYPLSLLLSLGAALFAVRVFIIFHDCCHGSFLRSGRANEALGILTGLLTFTPFHAWRHSHALHHATSGDLDRRGHGDVWTLTRREYHARPWYVRVAYRLYRNPVVMFGVGPLFAFLVLMRIPAANSATSARDRASVWWTNLALLAGVAALCWAVGPWAFLAVQLPVAAIAGGIGVWLFYVQHQYPNAYWQRRQAWDYFEAALYGSSYYQLPRLLQWFSGNIGFHHVHHLNPRIPNYRLQACHEALPALRAVAPLTLRASLCSLRVRLWDEDQRRMVGFQAPADEAVANLPTRH